MLCLGRPKAFFGVYVHVFVGMRVFVCVRVFGVRVRVFVGVACVPIWRKSHGQFEDCPSARVAQGGFVCNLLAILADTGVTVKAKPRASFVSFRWLSKRVLLPDVLSSPANRSVARLLFFFF